MKLVNFGPFRQVRLIGLDNVPRGESVIFAPNHVSYKDPPAIGGKTPIQMRAMAKAELFKGIMGWWLLSVGVYPVKRGEADLEILRVSLKILKSGQNLLIFPEGTRGDGFHMLPLSKGVSFLAKKSKVKVVPVGIVGTHHKKVTPEKPKPKGPVIVAFGDPFTYAEVTPSGKTEEFDRYLSARIVELCNAHGYPLQLQAPDPETLVQPQ